MSERLPARITRRNATFQQWQALLGSRTKRHRRGEMIVQGVRPITRALASGIDVHAVLVEDRPRRSDWAREILAAPPGPVVELSAELMAELGEREEGSPELLLVAALPGDDLARLDTVPADGLVLVFDRPSTPGNIGSLARTADALGADALVLTGHSADAWDPASIRASTGSMFALPVLRLPSHRELLDWVEARRAAGAPWQVIGLDEARGRTLADTDLTGPRVLVIGTETSGLSAGWRESCDAFAEIPMGGTASSLNAAVAGSIALYERDRQRRV